MTHTYVGNNIAIESSTEVTYIFKIPVVSTVTLTPDDLADVLTTALDGCYEWFSKYKSNMPRKDVVGDDDTFFESHGIISYYSNMAPAVGGTLTFIIEDHEDDNNVFVLTREKLLSGIYLFLNPDNNNCGESYYDDRDIHELTQNIDLNDADIILQLALFGEVIYG